MIKKQLFVFPFAGGYASFYKNYFTSLNHTYDVFCVEAKGHGTRISQGLIHNFNDYADDVFSQIFARINCNEIVLFGHSLGGYTALDMALKLGMLCPDINTSLIISAINAPNSSIYLEKKSRLSDDMFLDYFNRNKLFQAELANNERLQRLFIPILRADMAVGESFIPPAGVRVDCDITVLYGIDDYSTSYEQLTEWENLTAGNFRINRFKGGHFFITGLDNQAKINSLILSLGNERRQSNEKRGLISRSGITI